MKLSVIIPQSLSDPRTSLEFIESWSRQTGVDPEDYEIVVAVSDRDESAVRKCRELVRPHDQVIAFRGENDLHYYEAGIHASRGRLLLLTENHVVADEKCVAGVLGFFERTDSRCAFLKAKHINHSRFARHEGESYDRQVAEIFLQPECWDRVHLRAFVIDRDVLGSMGGIPWQYELFCAPLLSLNLLRQSIPIDYCPDAVIHHVNISKRSFLQHEIRSYVEQECRYRDEQHFDDDELLLGSNVILDRRRLWQDNLAGNGASALVAALRARRTGSSRQSVLSWWTLLATALRWRILAALGPRVLLWSAWRNYLWQRLRYGVLRFSAAKGNYAFENLWSATADLECARYCVSHPEPPVGAGASSLGAGVRLFIGFHGLAERGERRFRWSEPVAMVSLELEDDDAEICIDTGGLRGPNCGYRFELYFNGRRIEPSGIGIAEGCIRFRVKSEWNRKNTAQQLLILTQPVATGRKPAGGRRQLGMPICSIACQSVPFGATTESKAA